MFCGSYLSLARCIEVSGASQTFLLLLEALRALPKSEILSHLGTLLNFFDSPHHTLEQWEKFLLFSKAIVNNFSPSIFTDCGVKDEHLNWQFEELHRTFLQENHRTDQYVLFRC